MANMAAMAHYIHCNTSPTIRPTILLLPIFLNVSSPNHSDQEHSPTMICRGGEVLRCVYDCCSIAMSSHLLLANFVVFVFLSMSCSYMFCFGTVQYPSIVVCICLHYLPGETRLVILLAFLFYFIYILLLCWDPWINDGL